LNVNRFRSATGVRGVVSDEKQLNASVLFENGDMLKVHSGGCYSHEIEIRLWTDKIRFLDKDVIERTKHVMGIVFDAAKAKELDHSMDSRISNLKFDQPRLISTPDYQLTVTIDVLDDLNTLLKIEYLAGLTTPHTP
jgi:hypothetical protein